MRDDRLVFIFGVFLPVFVLLATRRARRAASHWNGRTLVRPNVTYTHWDAEKVQGCLCDDGYSGFNCSRVDCPTGDVPETGGQKNEVLRLECQASSGSFAVTFRGYTTRALPHDVPYGHLKRALEDLPSIGEVRVSFLDGATTACGADAFVETEIEFRSDFGHLPAARATPFLPVFFFRRPSGRDAARARAGSTSTAPSAS